MKKITLLMFLVAFAFSANAQLAFNQNPINNPDHLANAGIKVETVRTITPSENQYVAAETADIDITWHWTSWRAANVTWTPEATELTTGARNIGVPTTVPPSFYSWTMSEADRVSYPNAAPNGDYLMPPQTASTRRGFVMKVKYRDGTIQDLRTSGFSRGQSSWFGLGETMNGGGDPVWFNSVEDMMAYVKSGKFLLSDNTYNNNKLNNENPRADYGIIHADLHTHATNADYPNGFNTADSALAVVLNKNGGGKDGDGALAIYPGIFKEIDLRFAFRSDRHQWTRDIEFDVLTMDEGNTGKKAVYDIIVSITYNNLAPNPERDNTDSISLGTTGEILGGYTFNDPVSGQPTQVGRRWLAGTYTTGDPVKTINIMKIMGLKPHELFNRTIVVALQTKGTEGDTDNPSGTYDPIIAIDNIKWGGWNVQLDAAQWDNAKEPLLPVREDNVNIPVIIKDKTQDVLRIEYFDLTGRRVNENTRGFVIQKLFYKDGTTGSKKLFVR